MRARWAGRALASGVYLAAAWRLGPAWMREAAREELAHARLHLPRPALGVGKGRPR